MSQAAHTPSLSTPAHRLAQIARRDVRRALAEDVGTGDWTAQLIASDTRASARILAREPALLCGQAWVNAAMHACAPEATLQWHVQDGQPSHPNQDIVHIHGPAAGILTAERTALNFLQLLSAVATKTAQYVQAVAGTNACIVDTRKTIPGLRLAQKYAVRCGGGVNHRIGLYDAILIKENHIAAAGGVAAALRLAQATMACVRFIQIEVERLDQLQQALDAGAQMILLDNMPLPMLEQAVRLNAGRAILEVSGGVTFERLRELALTGVDRISVGSLTKDIEAIDFSMLFEGL